MDGQTIWLIEMRGRIWKYQKNDNDGDDDDGDDGDGGGVGDEAIK